MSCEVDYLINKAEKLASLCRLCLSENTKKSKCLYEKNDNGCIADLVMLFARIQLNIGDGFPQIICELCQGELELANSFKLKCEKSNSLLKKFYINGTFNYTVELVKPADLANTDDDIIKLELPDDDWIKSEDGDDLESEAINYSPSDSSLSDKVKYKIKKVKGLSKNSCSLPSSENVDIKPVGEDDGIKIVSKREESSVKKKQKKDNDNIKFICELCSRPLASKNSLENHIRTMHSIERKNRVGHVTGYGANKKYHCSECAYSSAKRHNLVYHQRVHSGEKPFQCKLCNARFSQAGSLSGHSKTHSNVTYFMCPICGKQFKHKNKYERHKLVHNNIRKFPCQICNKSFKTNYALKQHINRHLNIRNYSCETCGATFVSSGALIIHRKKHDPRENEKYECSICDFKTRLKHNLVMHINRHSGDRPFKCEVCEFSAYDAASIRKHTKSHTREKNYACPLCNMKFIHSTSVNKHVLRLHGLKYKVSDFSDRRIIK